MLLCQGSINWLSHLVNRLLIAMFAICNRFHYPNAIRMQQQVRPSGATCWLLALSTRPVQHTVQTRTRTAPGGINAKRDLIN